MIDKGKYYQFIISAVASCVITAIHGDAMYSIVLNGNIWSYLYFMSVYVIGTSLLMGLPAMELGIRYEWDIKLYDAVQDLREPSKNVYRKASSLVMPLMGFATAHGHESKSQRGLIRYEYGGDEDHKGEAHAQSLERDEPHQQGQTLSWRQILDKIDDLEARLDKIQAAEEATFIDSHS